MSQSTLSDAAWGAMSAGVGVFAACLGGLKLIELASQGDPVYRQPEVPH